MHQHLERARNLWIWGVNLNAETNIDVTNPVVRNNHDAKEMVIRAMKLYLKALSDEKDNKFAAQIILFLGNDYESKNGNKFERIYKSLQLVQKVILRKKMEKPKELRRVLRKFMPGIWKLRDGMEQTLSKENIYSLWNTMKIYGVKNIRTKNNEDDDIKFRIELEKNITAMVQTRVPEMRKKTKEMVAEKQKESVDSLSKSMKAKRIVNCLSLNDKKAADIGNILARQTRLVGLDVVKAYISHMIEDIIGRRGLKETCTLRHILISGNPGSGKLTAAKLISDWFDVLTPTSTSVKSKESFEVGKKVMLSKDFAKHSDAKDGPLKKGDIGVIEKQVVVALQLSICTSWGYVEQALEPIKINKKTRVESLDGLIELLEHVEERLKSQSQCIGQLGTIHHFL